MRPVFAALCGFAVLFRCAIAADQGNVRFNQSIRPILSDNCFACHGPDAKQRKGKLRLDVREAALEKKAIVPGQPDESELVKRIFTTDADDLMPPPDSHKVLTSEQKNLLKRWIAEGAVYEGHWSYISPVKPQTPAGKNGIDHLVRVRLKTVGLKPSPEAGRRTLARRLYFDLVGLPPKPEEVEAFEKNSSPKAYDDLVEKLLASPHYGERMALPWLDVVRFADTIGYHSDNARNIWPYRDYVIRAFNENKPFNQFTREQLAGDLLPNSGLEQKVGSAFNRLLLTTEEGGAQPRDYEYRMLTDRVRAVGTVWLGQTIGCANCHDHKFDPIKQKDFFAMGAFFADIAEPILGRREPGMLVPTASQESQLKALEEKVARLQKDYDGEHAELAEPFETWQEEQLAALKNENFWRQLKPSELKSESGAKLEAQSNRSILVKGKKPEKDTYTLTFASAPNPISGLRLEALPHDSLPSKGSGRAGNGNFVVTEIKAELKRATGETVPVSFARAQASFEQTFAADENPEKRWGASAVVDGNTEKYGWAILPEVTKPQQLVLELASPIKFEEGDSLAVTIFQNHGAGNHTLGHFRISASSSYDVVRAPLASRPKDEIAAVLKIPKEQRDAKQKEVLFAHFKSIAPELADLRKQIAAAQKEKNAFEDSIPRCLVSVSSDKPRKVQVLPRGNFLIETGEEVQPALPIFLAGKPTEKKLTRLDLADWLVSRDNPLTARVTMNRLWKQFFGIGLSKVLDDLGAQGDPPPNQALLDWLACEFMDSGWDIKHMVRLIVTSDTYKQTSSAAPELRARDPYNRELAAQSRWRLEAELVRDNALAISGLLVPKIGGPSVKPYQPEGYWENLNFPPRTYDASKDDGQYRRGLYTWWQRSFVHPSMLAFDAPTREECVAERSPSNIPQQALVLLNDPSYVETSRALAERILKECSGDLRTRITWAWRQALSRSPSNDELATLEKLFNKHLAEYSANLTAAEALLGVGLKPAPDDLNKPELAAWTNVARAILNLHETITRS
jgi:hypothetical protein